MRLPPAAVVRGNALRLPLRDASVDLIVTSPPYFALRSYRDGDEHYEGQIGSEETPEAFLAALWAATAEMWRVLKPSGSVFVQLGDKYAGSGGHNNNGLGASTLNGHGGTGTPRDRGVKETTATRRNAPDRYNQSTGGIRAKSLMLLPERYRIGCIDGLAAPDGQRWIARAVIIHSKLNCLSGGTQLYARVKGRPTSVKVHDLCRAYQPEDVQLWNGTKWTQVVWWEPTGRHPEAAESYKAIRAARRRGDEPAIGGDVEIEFLNGERVGCTRKHRWPTQRGLVQAADLAVGDVVEATTLPEGEAHPDALDDETVGWFVGLYIAEGSRSGTTIQIAGHLDELERYKRLRSLAQAFHANCAVHAVGGQGATINLTGRFLDAILASYVSGRTAKDKHLAPKAWQRSNRFLRAVLDGYLSGDGHYVAKDRHYVVRFTDNDYWASDLRTLGARLGASVRLRRCTHTGFGRQWPGWGGNIITDGRPRRQPDTRIVAIRQSRARQFWDIGVADEPHLFALASGVLTHNSLPESVTDRVRRSHEDWVHLVKEGRYFAAVDEVREAQTGTAHARRADGATPPKNAVGLASGVRNGYFPETTENPLGKLPGSVWSLASEPLIVPEEVQRRLSLPDHFAAFGQEVVRRIVLGWSPSGICTRCNEGRRPVVEKALRLDHLQDRRRGFTLPDDDGSGGTARVMGAGVDLPVGSTEATITRYACACPDTSAPTRPSVVADPFGGTGTTAMVARALGRIGVSVDLSHDYSRLARWRIFESDAWHKSEARLYAERQGVLL